MDNPLNILRYGRDMKFAAYKDGNLEPGLYVYIEDAKYATHVRRVGHYITPQTYTYTSITRSTAVESDEVLKSRARARMYKLMPHKVEALKQYQQYLEDEEDKSKDLAEELRADLEALFGWYRCLTDRFIRACSHRVDPFKYDDVALLIHDALPQLHTCDKSSGFYAFWHGVAQGWITELGKGYDEDICLYSHGKTYVILCRHDTEPMFAKFDASTQEFIDNNDTAYLRSDIRYVQDLP